MKNRKINFVIYNEKINEKKIIIDELCKNLIFIDENIHKVKFNQKYGKNILNIMNKFSKIGIETRPIWKLNHLQKPYLNNQTYKIEKAKELVSNSVCLPSSISLTTEQLEKIIKVING